MNRYMEKVDDVVLEAINIFSESSMGSSGIEDGGEMKPLSNTVIILIIAKICGRVSASRLHKIVYIFKMKYHIL